MTAAPDAMLPLKQKKTISLFMSRQGESGSLTSDVHFNVENDIRDIQGNVKNADHDAGFHQI